VQFARGLDLGWPTACDKFLAVLISRFIRISLSEGKPMCNGENYQMRNNCRTGANGLKNAS
jgi:hypothetical protein